MELIVISDPGTVAGEAAIINQLFEAGLKRFHLRKPNWTDDQCIELLQEINPAFHQSIALHQHHHLKDHFEITRLHYTEKNRVATGQKNLREDQENGLILSTSIHQLEDVPMQRYFDYVFFSPVFNSISKPDYKSTLEKGFSLKKLPQSQIIALGGIDETNLKQVIDMNFDGAAILGAIWNNPSQALIKFIKIKKCSEKI